MNEDKNIDPKLAVALKGIWDSLTDEQKEKAKACKSEEELLEFAAKEGIELSDEVLDAVSGGYIHLGERYKDGWHDLWWEVISDTTGEVLYRTDDEDDYWDANQWAVEHGQSTKELYDAELQQFRDSLKKKGC